MIRSRHSSAEPGSGPAAAAGSELSCDRVEVSGGSVARTPASPSCRDFLRRVFTLPTVSQVEIDPVSSAFHISYASTTAKATLLREMAERLREQVTHGVGETQQLYLGTTANRPIHVTRYDDTLSTWKIVHRLPGRMRVQHPALPRTASAMREVERELTTVAGVAAVRANVRSGTVLVEFDEQQLSVSRLLRLLEGLVATILEPLSRGYRHAGGSLLVPTASLALAVAADFLVPALAPASAAVLIGVNLPQVVRAARELVGCRPGMSTLYTTILGCTLASGFFFPAALMGWCMQFWDRSYHARLATAQRALLRPYQPQTYRVRRCVAQHWEADHPVLDLQPGDAVLVHDGEVIPADGVVLAGTACVVTERATNDESGQRRQAGERVYAGERVRGGELRVRVERVGNRTRAAAIGHLLEQASMPAPAPLKERGAPFARRIVVPTMALAGVGALVGDIGTTLAILRPDYATGAGMTHPMAVLQRVSYAARRGVIVRSPEALEELSHLDRLVVQLPEYHGDAVRGSQKAPGPAGDGEPAWAAPLARLRSALDLPVTLVAETGDPAAQALSQRWGCDLWPVRRGCDDLPQWLRDQRRQGKRVGFVGDCRAENVSAEEATVALSWGDVTRHAEDPAHLFLLDGDFSRIVDLRQLARQQRRQNRWQLACTLVPNACCVAGAFALGFTGLHAVVLSNLGVYATYKLGTRWLTAKPAVAGG
ncbi:MAG: hypothetical protein U0935_02185 [Pirellulales bacterium]